MTGKIERGITRAVREMQQRGMKVAVHATDVVSNVYGNAEPTRCQFVAVLHEMRSFVRKHQAYVLAGGQGPYRLCIIMADEATPGIPNATSLHAPGAPLTSQPAAASAADLCRRGDY